MCTWCCFKRKKGFYNLTGFVNGVLRQIARSKENLTFPEKEDDEDEDEEEKDKNNPCENSVLFSRKAVNTALINKIEIILIHGRIMPRKPQMLRIRLYIKLVFLPIITKTP